MLTALMQSGPVPARLQRFGTLDLDAPGPIPRASRLGFVLRSKLTNALGTAVGAWGLVPSRLPAAEAGDFVAKYGSQCARAESVATKVLWADAFKRRRCAIPVEGFFLTDTHSEFRPTYAVSDIDEEVTWLAGLWDYHSSIGFSCAVITTESNSTIWLDPRMPVILDKLRARQWIDGGDQALLCPWPAQLTAMQRVEDLKSWAQLRASATESRRIRAENVARVVQGALPRIPTFAEATGAAPIPEG